MDTMGSEVLPVPSRPVTQEGVGARATSSSGPWGRLQESLLGPLPRLLPGHIPSAPPPLGSQSSPHTGRPRQLFEAKATLGQPSTCRQSPGRGQRHMTWGPHSPSREQGRSSNVRAVSRGAQGPRDPQGLLASSLQDLPAESQPPGRLGQSPQHGMPSLPRRGPGSTLRPGCLRPRPRPPARCPWWGPHGPLPTC